MPPPREFGSRAKEVYRSVAEKLEDQNSREVWSQLSTELLRVGGGPDGCRSFLDAQPKSLEVRTRRELLAVKEEAVF